MDNTFTRSFINQTGCSCKSCFCFFWRAGLGYSNYFTSCIADSSLDRSIFCTTFASVLHYDGRFNVRQRIHLLQLNTFTQVFYHEGVNSARDFCKLFHKRLYLIILVAIRSGLMSAKERFSNGFGRITQGQS